MPDMVFKGSADEAYRVWAQMAATDWKHLPAAGGLLDQPAALWDDVMTIEFMHRRVKESQESG